MSDTAAKIQDLVRRYHQAFKDADWDALRACYGDSYIRWSGNGSTDPADWVPEAYCTRDYMMRWGEMHVEGAVYEIEIEFVRTQVGEDLAICTTRESGSWTFPAGSNGPESTSWKEVTNVWFVALMEGEWKIAGMFWPETGEKG